MEVVCRIEAQVSKTFHIIPSSKSCDYVLNTLMQVIRRDAVFLRFQVIVLQLEFLMLKDNEAKVLNVSDAIEENNAFDATSSHLTELEANEVVNDGDMELLTDVESTSGIDARDQDSELVLVDGKQDDAEVVGVADEQNSNEADVLENNGVIGVGVNENNEGSKGILEDVPEVNKKVAHVIIENSENGVSSDADLDETVIHINVNGDSVDHRTQPDDEISGEKVEQNEEVVPKHFKPSSSAIHETEVERQPSFDDKVSESIADSSEIREQKDEDKPLNKEPESRPVIGVSLSTAKSVAPTHTAVPNLKDDPKLNRSTPTPYFQSNTPPTLRPFLAPVLTRPAGIGRSAPLLEPAHRVAQSKANGNVLHSDQSCPNGTATSYDMFVTQRSHVVQQAIRQAAGDMRLMNPVSLVENHSACRTNRNGQRVLPNGQVWKPHLLLLSFASKILVEANMLLKLQGSPPGKPFAARNQAPPLPYILSTLLQSRPQLKLPQEQFGDDDDDAFDGDIDESSDEELSEYDELPPFKRLTNAQVSTLSKAQKKSYYDELEYREKLFMKKQLKEEKKRRKMMKKMAEAAKNFPTELTDNNVEEDSNAAATVPDMTLPASFDADNPTHRYRALDSANQWLIRPVLDPHGWDHDVGYEGINVEHLLALKEKIPVSFSGQVTKDKKDANLQMEVSSAMKHGKSKSTTVAFDMQTFGKEMSYSLRSETRFISYRKNKASAGLSATYFGDTLTGGVKFEDKLMINKQGELVVAGGAVIARGEVAYGGNLEATLRDKDFPLGRFLSTIGLAVMDWHGDLALGWNAQSQIPIGRSTNLIGSVNLNNKGSGLVSVRLNSSDQLQFALAALVPLVSKLIGYYQARDSGY
ncbi:translocase of chloroplast 120, chloroplastic-like protein [Tanacetum coccineum]